MAAQTEIKLTFNYDDETTRDIKIGPFDTDAAVVQASALRTSAKAFNPQTVKGFFLSDTGATCTGLTGATIYETSETEINLND